MRIEITSAVLAGIVAEAAASPDAEVCGLLLGEGMRVAAARACANVAADPARRFEIDPVVLLGAHRTARQGGAAVIGHYHSHPSGAPLPSARDASDAVPDGTIWLIVAGGAARAWRAVHDGAVQGRFDPVAITVLPPCVDSPRPPEDEPG